MRAWLKLFGLVAVAVAVQCVLSIDLNTLDDAQLTVRVACVRFLGGSGNEPWIEEAAHRVVERQYRRHIASLDAEQRTRVEQWIARANDEELDS